MALVQTTPPSELESELTPNLTALEVRSGAMILTIKEQADGALLVASVCAAGFGLVVDGAAKGNSHRTMIRTRAVGR